MKRLLSVLLSCLLLLIPSAAGARNESDAWASRANRGADAHLPSPLAGSATWTFTCPAAGSWARRPSVICATVQDSDGLRGDTASYRYSVDGGSNWSDWLSDGLAYSSSGATTVYLTLTTSSLIDSVSLNQVEFRIRDLGDIEELSGPRTIPVDGTPPTVTATPDKTGTWVQPPVRITLQASDALSGVDRTEYRLQGTMTWQMGTQILIDGSQGDRTYTYEYRAYDRAGNTSGVQTISVNVDGTPPGPPTNIFCTPPGWSNVNAFGLSWTNPADPSGIGGVYYQLDIDPLVGGTPIGPILGENISSLSGITVSGEGSHTVYIWLVDRAGNSSASTRAVRSNAFNYDITPPTTTPSYAPPLPPGGWFSGTVGVTLEATDNASGIQETRWRRVGGLWNVGNSFSVSESGSYEYQSVDRAGNSEAVKSLTVQIDTVPPTSSIAVFPPPPPSGWYTGPVTVTISAVDPSPGSGWAGEAYYQVDGGPWQQGNVAVISTNGTHTLAYYAVDVAGNRESPQTASNLCRIDQEAPAISATPSKTGLCLQPPVTVTLVATDTLSGVAWMQYRRLGTSSWITYTTPFTVTGADGLYVYEYRGQDIAGNTSPTQTVTLNIDGTPPGQPTNLAATPVGWTNVNTFTLSWVNPPDPCGIAGVYYQIGVDPITGGTPIGPITGTGISSISAVTVPSQGQHTVYLWLLDGAGNSDRYSRQVLLNGLKYDATPPYSDPATVQGPLGEDPLWFTDCVTVTITGNDALSGVAALYYQVEGQGVVTVPVSGGPPTARHSFSLCYDCGRKTISYWARDVASNTQAVSGTITVRMDRQAPAAPISPTVSPASWSNSNNFAICWSNPPEECSGVVAVYYKKGSPPTANGDGQLYALPLGAPSCIPGLTVDREGQTPVYIWLKDRVGLADYRTAISVTLRYDRTPPTTGITVTGTTGRNGWYTSPVNVRFGPNDNASGVTETRYRLDGGAWQLWGGADVALNTEGTHVVEYYSVDAAGNREATQTTTIKLDLTAPSCTLRVTPDYVGRSVEGANVCWTGTDGPKGSGIAKYTVQYRKGACGSWQDWLPEIAAAITCTTRTGLTTNDFHYFRVRAEDNAGRVGAWSSPGSDFLYVEGLSNASFDSCDWPLWIPSTDSAGKLTARVLEATTRTGGSSCMARLSKEWPLSDVPVNAYASFYQSIQLPPLECGRNQGLMLSFWYRILTYDNAWGKLPNNTYGWLDTFEVRILDRDGRELAEVLRDGHFGEHAANTLYDLGWRHYRVDLTPWAGQQIRVEFKVWNRVDKWYPTWVYVDDVKLLPSASQNYNLAVPLIMNRSRQGGAAGATASPGGQLAPLAKPEYNGGDQAPKRS